MYIINNHYNYFFRQNCPTTTLPIATISTATTTAVWRPQQFLQLFFKDWICPYVSSSTNHLLFYTLEYATWESSNKEGYLQQQCTHTHTHTYYYLLFCLHYFLVCLSLSLSHTHIHLKLLRSSVEDFGVYLDLQANKKPMNRTKSLQKKLILSHVSFFNCLPRKMFVVCHTRKLVLWKNVNNMLYFLN